MPNNSTRDTPERRHTVGRCAGEHGGDGHAAPVPGSLTLRLHRRRTTASTLESTKSTRKAAGNGRGLHRPPRGRQRPALSLRSSPVRFHGSVTYISRIAKRRSTTGSAIGASASAASASPVSVVRTRATAGVPGNRLVDQELPDLGVCASRQATGRRTRRRAAGQDANRPRRPGQTDAVRHPFVLSLGHPKPRSVVLAELLDKRPHPRRCRRSRQAVVLVLQGILLGRAVIPLHLHVSAVEGSAAGQCHCDDVVTTLGRIRKETIQEAAETRAAQRRPPRGRSSD